jgi:hypothetical protein
MQDQLQIIRNFPTINRLGEDIKYNQSLYSVTLFPYNSYLAKGRLYRIVLNFSFRGIHFNKKQALPFFFSNGIINKTKMYSNFIFKKCISLKIT